MQPAESEEPTSVLLPLPKPPADPTPPRGQDRSVVEWKPPHVDWNPWTCCSAYQMGGAYDTMEPEARADQLSQNLYQEMTQRKTNDLSLVKASNSR